jgi:hypothetical protein
MSCQFHSRHRMDAAHCWQARERAGSYPLVATTVEGEGYDRRSLLLPGSQLDLIQVLPLLRAPQGRSHLCPYQVAADAGSQ